MMAPEAIYALNHVRLIALEGAADELVFSFKTFADILKSKGQSR
jgi:hypothetical protein